MNGKHLKAMLLGAAFGVFAAACSDNPTPFEQATPETEPGNLITVFDHNPTGACMGDDVLSYNALAPANQKASWSKTAIPGGNYCTANDIYLASATVYAVLVDDVWEPVSGPITCVEGETFEVKVAAQLGQNAASARSDIGVWIAQALGQTQAVTGACNHYNLVPNVNGALSLDDPPDQCGDMASAAGELLELDLDQLTLVCSPNENNKVEVPACIGWTQPGGDRVCPYPSGSADPINFAMGTVPGNTSKCNCEPFELDIVVLEKAYLEVRKELDPTDDDGKFDLYIDMGTADQISAANQGHNGSTGKQEVGAGTSVEPGATHSFAETAAAGYDLADYETSWECRDRGGAAGSRGSGTGPGPEDITLQPDDDVVCTFTNARNPEVKLVKAFAPTDDGGKVSFTIDGQPYNNGGAGYGHGQGTAFIQFDIGDDVAFSEAGFGGTDLSKYESSWACDNLEEATGTSGSTGTLAAGDQVTCTFTNERKPEVKVVKAFEPITDPGKVGFTIDGQAYDNTGAGYGHGQGTDFIVFDIGDDVAFSEAGFGGTDLTGYTSVWACDNGEAGLGTSGSTGALAAGDQVTCTFTNTLIPVEESETAWAANGTEPGSLLYNLNGGGNWATYVQYDGFAKVVNLYAGQTEYAGTVSFSAPVDGQVTITIALASGFSYEAGSVIAVQDYVSAPSGNPSPGQFAYKFQPGDPIVVPQNSYYGVHTVVMN